MKLDRLLPPRVLAAWQATLRRLDALPDRERYTLLIGALALLVAAEALLVLPVKDKRRAVQAAAAVQAESEASAAAEAQAAQAQRLAELQAVLARLDQDLSRLGASKSSGEPLSFLLSRALAKNGAQVVGLRELGVEDIDASAGAAAAASAPTPALTPALTLGSATASTTLYRHRFELQLAGDVKALIDALQALDQGARPLRIERVRLGSASAGPAGQRVEAAVTLSVIGTERSWLSL